MALEDLNPAVRVEEILDGADIEPATRLEYFMKKAANEVPKPAGSSDAGKVVTVNEDGDGFELAEAAAGGVINVHVDEVTAAGNSADMAIIVDGTELSSYNACHEYLASIKDNCIHIALPIGWTAPVLFFDDGESMAFLATLAKEGSQVNETRIGWVAGHT